MGFSLDEVKIEVTHNCPLGCVHCSSVTDKANQIEISKEKCIQLIDEASELGVKSIVISGGEPLIWTHIREVVDYISRKNIIAVVYTSGNVFVGSAKKLLSELVQLGLRRIAFSVYSNVAAEHNKITRKANSFKNTIDAIKSAVSLGIDTEIHFVAMANNYRKIPALVELAKTLNVGRVSILRFVPQGRGAIIKEKETLNKAQHLELKKIIETIRDTGFEIRTGSPFNFLHVNKNPKCLAGQDRLIITPDLRIYPCDAFKHITAESLVNDITTSDLGLCSLSECWKDSEYLKLVRNHIACQQKCLSCVKFDCCNSGCLAQKILHYEKVVDDKDPACILGEVIR